MYIKSLIKQRGTEENRDMKWYNKKKSNIYILCYIYLVIYLNKWTFNAVLILFMFM